MAARLGEACGVRRGGVVDCVSERAIAHLIVRKPYEHEHVASLNDEPHLIAQLQSGDPRAFESVFRTFAAPLCDLAFSYVRTRDGAEDIVQELFTWLWANRHEFLPTHGLRAYLFGAVRNRSLNVLRNEATAARVSATLQLPPTSAARTADADLLAADLETALRSAVEGMPPRCRDVFTLVRTQSLSYAEVAAILGVAPKTVEVHMGRALAILRVRLGPWLNG